MQIFQGFRDKRIRNRPRCIAIGIFDGVHRGHQKIIARAVRDAKRIGASSTVITFDPHPNKVLRPAVSHPILMTLSHRLNFFEKIGVNEVILVHFNERFAKISHRHFLDELLFGQLGMKSLSVGKDFRFGFRGLGDARTLLEGSKRLGFQLSLAKPVKAGHDIISSTRIRKLIEKGELNKAERMLGRPVSVYGTVEHGRGRGRSLGFPTANLNPHHETLPPGGVYAAWGSLNGTKLKAVIHIGKRPTFKDRQKSLEAHFFNFHRNIYGSAIELFFKKRIRGTRAFGSPEALTRAIRKDIDHASKIL